MTGLGSTILTILEFVLVFGALVFLHELGHFIAARLNKIDVEEFGFGYPPKMFRLFRAGGTDFTFNWIPFGGFCRMKGEAGETMEAGSFPAANPWRRLTTLLAGPITNLLVGVIIFAVIFSRIGAPDTSKVIITDIAPNSPASVDLQIGDLIEQINGIPITSMNKLNMVVAANLGQPIEMTILRDSKPLQIAITPRVAPPAGEGAMGIAIYNPVTEKNFFTAIPMALSATAEYGAQLLKLPGRLISGKAAPGEGRISSVVGIYSYFSYIKNTDQEEATIDPSLKGLNILSFVALISVALGYTNLLPIPALDGGHILFLIPEILFKKRVKPEFEGRVHFIGYVLLLALMVVLVINDIVNPVTLH